MRGGRGGEPARARLRVARAHQHAPYIAQSASKNFGARKPCAKGKTGCSRAQPGFGLRVLPWRFSGYFSAQRGALKCAPKSPFLGSPWGPGTSFGRVAWPQPSGTEGRFTGLSTSVRGGRGGEPARARLRAARAHQHAHYNAQSFSKNFGARKPCAKGKTGCFRAQPVFGLRVLPWRFSGYCFAQRGALKCAPNGCGVPPNRLSWVLHGSWDQFG